MAAIDGLGRVERSGAAGGRRAVRTGGFALPGEAPAATAGPSGVPEVSLADLLILQEVEDGPTRDRVARRHGRAMLAELGALQRSLLSESLDAAPLRRLAVLAADVPLAADPALREAVEEVTVRAWVELARFGIS